MTRQPLPSVVDLAVIGAGPAGLAAACEARSHGLTVAVLDEQPSPGGQIYRDITNQRSAGREAILGADYLAGSALAEDFLRSGSAYVSGAKVWHISADGVAFSSADGGGTIEAGRVLAATGAMERPFPLPGWTLPGVLTAGAAQILLKTSGLVADDAVFIGTGPLLYLVVCQYLKAGARVSAVIDTADPAARFRALPHLAGALCRPGILMKGLGLLATIRRSGVPVIRGAVDIALEGEAAVTSVRWRDRSGETRRVACDHAFLHQGVIPNLNITLAARAAHRWDEAQACWTVEHDAHGRTSEPWLIVAGDGGGIGGARAAALSGRLAGLAAAHDLGRLDAAGFKTCSAPVLRTRAAEMAVRPFLDALYRPSDAYLAPRDDGVLLCRCEEVARADLAEAVAEGCPGPNQFKSFSRAGMGPCQGRLCGHSITAVMADLTGRFPADVGYYRLRMPIKPVTIGEIGGAGRLPEETS